MKQNTARPNTLTLGQAILTSPRIGGLRGLLTSPSIGGLRGRSLFPVLLTLCGCLLAPHAWGQTTSAPEKWAVIVGITDYQSESLENLQYSVQDADSLYQTLTDKDTGGLKPDHVIELTSGSVPALQPTAANIRAAIQKLAAKTRAQDTFWFYFSGHGADVGGKSYLLTQGFVLSKFPSAPVCLSTSEIRALLQNPAHGGVCRADRKILVLDACHSGSSKGLDTVRKRELTMRGIGMATLAACQTNQSSWEFPATGGVFTHFLTMGLAGDADRPENGGDGNGKVSVGEIEHYLSIRVDQFVYKSSLDSVHQNPVLVIDPAAKGLQVTVTNPDFVTKMRAVEQNGQTLAPREPLGPAVIVAFDETTHMPDGTDTPGETTETQVRADFLKQSFPVLDRKAARQLQSSLQSKDLKLVSRQIRASNSKYLLRGLATVSLEKLPEFQGPDGLTVRLYNATATITAELVDDSGVVLKSLVVKSGQQGDGQFDPNSVPTSANPQRAATIALLDASQQVSAQMSGLIKQLMAGE